jgi:hypothetical protein
LTFAAHTESCAPEKIEFDEEGAKRVAWVVLSAIVEEPQMLS